jgi:hypothetical protein
MTGQDRTGQDRTGQDRTGQDRTGQDRTGQDRTGQDRTGHSSSTAPLLYLGLVYGGSLRACVHALLLLHLSFELHDFERCSVGTTRIGAIAWTTTRRRELVNLAL